MATLHFRSPVYVQRGAGILFHKSPYYIQSGHGQVGAGIGSFFKSIFRFLAPAAKKTLQTVSNVGKKVLNNAAVQDVLDVVKQEAIRTGVNAAANVIAGNEVVPPMQSDIAEAREKIATHVKKIGGGRKHSLTHVNEPKKKKRKTIYESEPSIFDSD